MNSIVSTEVGAARIMRLGSIDLDILISFSGEFRAYVDELLAAADSDA